MNNILAIAQKELKAYFASPIAYVVIGLFALMFGYFYYALLGIFIIGGVGFSHIEAVHNAAHDYRHSMAFPCH